VSSVKTPAPGDLVDEAMAVENARLYALSLVASGASRRDLDVALTVWRKASDAYGAYLAARCAARGVRRSA